MAKTKEAVASPAVVAAVAGQTAALAAGAGGAVANYGAYEGLAGQGFENQTSDDYTIPFLQILQALSPQLEDNDDLKVGMILNSVTGEVTAGKDGVAFIPATTHHQYVEWKPRSAGGGFVAVHEPGDEMVKNCIANQDFGVYKTPDGNDLIETFYVYGISIDGDGSPSQAVLSFSGTKIKKYKAWMTKAKTIQIVLEGGRRIPAPLFAHRYRLRTVGEKNNKGSFANWDIGFDGENAMAARLAPDDEMVMSAIAIRELLDSGKARAAYESQTPGTDEAAPDAGAKPKF